MLYSFVGGSDGQYPFAGLLLDGAGNLYGTTSSGGTSIQEQCSRLMRRGLRLWSTAFKMEPMGQSLLPHWCEMPGERSTALPKTEAVRDVVARDAGLYSSWRRVG